MEMDDQRVLLQDGMGTRRACEGAVELPFRVKVGLEPDGKLGARQDPDLDRLLCALRGGCREELELVFDYVLGSLLVLWSEQLLPVLVLVEPVDVGELDLPLSARDQDNLVKSHARESEFHALEEQSTVG